MEFEDKDWLPGFMRDAMTGVLEVVISFAKLYDPAVHVIREITKDNGEHVIIDLCSGSGGGIKRIIRQLNEQGKWKVILTDLYPNKSKAAYYNSGYFNCFSYLEAPLDASKAWKLKGDIYTIFAGFHHFSDHEGEVILKNISKTGKPVVIMEGARKSIFAWLGAILFLPLIALLAVPFIRPFKWKYFVFTYLIPVIPLLVWWDGIASLASIKNENLIFELAERAVPEYMWRSRQDQVLFLKTYCVYGQPVPAK